MFENFCAGDGVEEAFVNTDRVMCVSFHKVHTL
jgi:acetoin utilization deacetylase AcuC-like enzyme